MKGPDFICPACGHTIAGFKFDLDKRVGKLACKNCGQVVTLNAERTEWIKADE